MDDFTPEEREYIDRLLEESDVEQKNNGNKTYTIEEVMDELFSIYTDEDEEYRRKLRIS